MNTPDNSIARIFDSKGQVVGAGFLVSANLVITCAHVINAISGSTDLATSIMIDFPLVESGNKISGRIIFLDLNKDVACLDVAGLLPNGANPAKLVIADNLWGHTFRTFGFPQGYNNGVWSSGVLRSNTGEGWLQIEDVKDTGFSIQPGFSGGPVWDDQLKAVVGIITAAEMDRSIKAAFCIPTRELMNAYPVLRQNIILACPYRSLDAFEEYDGQFFFGRDRVITKLLESIRREPRFLAVLGPSGSGKSSVVKAGLIPTLKEGKATGSNRWQVLTIRPGLQPFVQLESVGLTNLQFGLESSTARWLASNPGIQRLVVFIDQFEELLVSTPEKIKQNFISEIAQLLDSSNPCTVVLTLRDDFYSRFQQEAIPLVNWLERGLVNIPPILEVHELRDMIVRPAQRAGISFEDGLVENIISDAIEVDRTQEAARSTILPLLEFALTQMWEIRQSNTLSHHNYLSIGGVAGGLSQWADKAYHALNSEERLMAHRILTDLVNLGDDRQGIPNTKRIKKYNEIAYNEVAEGVVQKLVQARLLITGYDVSLEQDQVEIIHEALIYKWAQLLKWIEEDREYLIFLDQFAENAKDWEKSGRDSGLLYRGARLAKLIQWFDTRKNEGFNPSEKDFFEESLIQEKKVVNILRTLTEISSHLDLDRAFDRTLALINEALGAEQVTIMLLNKEDNLLYYHVGYEYFSGIATEKRHEFNLKIGEALPGWVVEHQEPALIDDLLLDSRWAQFASLSREYRSAIAVPMLVNKKVAGVLIVFHRKPSFFKADLLSTVTAIADQIAVALENARLYQSTLSTAERFKILNEASLEIGASLDPEIIYVTIHKAVKKLMPVESFVISLLVEETGEIEGVYLVDDDKLAPATRVVRDRGISGRVISSGEPLLLHGVDVSENTGPIASGKSKTPLSILAVPLMLSGKPVGVLSAQSYQPNVYSEDDLQILSTLANQAAAAIQNGRLYNETQQLAQELEQRVEQRTSDLNHALQQVEDRTADLSRANSNLARALRVKDEFLANMSHELRTPLNAILGLSESLAEQTAGTLNEKQQRYINTVSESGHHLLSLINDILDLAKIEAGQITLDVNKVDINLVCDASLRMVKQLARKKNQEIVLEIDKDLSVMWADERRLKQMLVNLFSNAVKFTPENGKIGLEVHGDHDENKVTFTIWDNGIGIKENDFPRLFQPFVKLDSGLPREAMGTGIGLALVAQMARLHGGNVSVTSELGKGSRFSIVLPWESGLVTNTREIRKIAGKIRNAKPESENRPIILLVEDTKEVVMMIQDYLEIAGYKVFTAQDGMDGIAQAKLTHPDLILMDIVMPQMDGFETTQKLRSDSEFTHTPIIALTALATPNDRKRCLAAGMNEHIGKPVNLKILLNTIQNLLFDQEETHLS